ncbi:iron-containing redox enzyme family protein [Nocardia sienata]|uniref:iron-containing redox enzyme family protein n=1 Tax=Nocardia sienata TaxID=248552 RepID=UPI0007A52E64|nr:iron-containing redox enzyme family protein [Nocardia sienata]
MVETLTPRATAVGAPALPMARGPLSAAVLTLLRDTPGRPVPDVPDDLDPYGDDLQLTLHTCYELHYHGFDGVDADWEWDPGLLRIRAELERRFLAALRAEVPGGADVTAELDRLLTVPVAGGVPRRLRDEGCWWQMREYFVQRSIYHHKEADPVAWVIPRLRGRAKAGLVAIEFDEFGGGHGDRIHARLYADLLRGAGLSDGYLHYLDIVPAPMLALVDMMSLFGLHRSMRGAIVGHFAAVEITSSPASKLMVEALHRFSAHADCVRFYSEHVTADAVHEQVVRREVLDDLLAHEPELAESVVFGIQATDLLEDRCSAQLLDRWRAGESSLRTTER